MATNLVSSQKWGDSEKAHWLSQQTIKRSYLEEVVEKITHLKKDFKVFRCLARQRDQVITKEQLLDALWVEPELVTPQVIDVAIKQIHQKIDKPFGITNIETERRRGYRFCFPNQTIS